MVRTAIGIVQGVADTPVGSQLKVDAAASSGSVTLESVADFPDTGQVVFESDDEVFEIKTYTAVDRTTGVLTLSGTTTNAFVRGEAAMVYPLQSSREAWVKFGDLPAGLVLVTVPFEFRDKLPLGPRDVVNGLGETVIIDLDLLTIIGLPTTVPVIDGGLIDPTTLPSTTSDGNPPGSSPTPSVLGGIGYLAIRWDGVANDDTVTYEVHVSESSGFTPGPTTKVAEIDGTLIFVRRLADGTPLAYETTYYVKLIAKDADGSAAAGAQGSGEMIPANSPDIAVEAITAGHILAGTITAEQLATVFAITNRLIAGVEDGQRVEMDTEGVRLVDANSDVVVNIPTDADATATFSGSLLASDITIQDRLRLQGTDNEVTGSAALTVAGGVSAPTSSPSATMDWQSLDLNDSSVFPHRGLHYDPNGDSGGATPTFLYCENGVGGRLIEVNASTGNVLRTHSFSASSPSQQPLGVTRVGTHVFVLYADTSETLIWVPGHWEPGPGGRWVYIPGHYESSSTSTIKLRKILQSTFATVSNTTLTSGVDVGQLGDNVPGIGTDGTNVCILTKLTKGSANPIIRRFNTTPASVDTVNLTGFPDGDDLNTPEFYSMVAQGGSWWITMKETQSAGHGGGGAPTGLPIGCYNFNTSGVYQDDRFFDLGGSAMRGTTHDGTQFRTIHEGSLLFQHTNWDWTTESPKYWAAYSWYDSAGTTHETPVSGAAPLTLSRRAQLVVTALSDFPGVGGADDPNSIRVYLNRGASEPTGGSPTRFSGYLQGASGSGTKTFTVTNFDNAGSPPENPATSDFPSAPALLESGGGEWQLYGDGTKIGFGDPWIYGNGSDGSAVFDGSATVLGLAPSGGIYTLTRDLFLDEMAIGGSAVINPACFRIFCRGTLTNDGAIRQNGANGGNGSGGTGGTGGADGTADGTWSRFSASSQGGAGGSGAANGGSGGNPTLVTGFTTGYRTAPGDGGDSDLAGAGFTSGTVAAADAPSANEGEFKHPFQLVESTTRQSAIYMAHYGANGSGGAGYASGQSGGGGGGGGGSFLICARNIVNNGAIEARGGNGGNGVTNGSGGGGGGGGVIGLLYESYTGNAPDVSGGSGGTKGSGQGAPAAGGPGSNLNSTTDATSFVTNSTTAVSGQHHLVAVNSAVSSGTANAPTLSGTNGWNATYTQVATQLYNGNLNRLTLFRVTCSSNTSGTTTADFAGQTQTGCQIVRVSSSTGNWLSQTPVQAATPATNTTGNASVSLPSTPSTPTHITIGFMVDLTTSANVTAGSGFTELTEVNQATGCGTMQVEYTSNAAAQQTASWTNTSGPWAAMAVEMDTGSNNNGAAGSTGTVLEIQLGD